MKIAIHQMCSGIEQARNLTEMVNAIAKSAADGACMYFAPEMSVLLDRDRKRARQQIFSEAESSAIAELQKAAATAGIWVHLGSLPVAHETGGGMIANRSIIIDSTGTVVARYDKMHLFDVDLAAGESWRESNAYVAGNSPVIVDAPIGQLGLTICYDLRFPDLFSALSRAGISALAVPAAFTVPTGRAHWHSLLRARAIEAEAFVIAAAQSGMHEDGRETYGHSLVVDPWGDVILDMGEDEGLAVVEVNLDRIQEVREQIPVHANRRDIPPNVRRY